MAKSFTAAGTPLLTPALVVVTLLAYFFELADGRGACDTYGLVPASLEPSALVTSLFVHDPDHIAHVAGNVAFLALFGFIVEPALGKLRFLALYFGAGAVGGLCHVLVDPSSTNPLVGCSGAVFGLLAVATVLRPRFIGFAVTLVGINIWQAFSGSVQSESFGCHIGGFVVGFVTVAALRLARSEALEPA